MATRSSTSPMFMPKACLLIVTAIGLALLSCTQEVLQSSPGDPPADSTWNESIRPEPVVAEPGNRFVRIDADTFADRSQQISIEDAISLPDLPGWMFVGSVEDGRTRSRSAVVSMFSTEDDSGHNLATLPSGDLAAAATTVQNLNGQFFVGGYIVRGGSSKPVVWTFEANPTEATATELPTTSQDAQATRFGPSDLGPVVIGSETVDGQTNPVVWRYSGNTWRSIPIQDTRDATDTGNLSMTSATLWRGQLVVVGTSNDSTQDPTPMVWTETDGQLQVMTTTGLPPTGELNDIVVTSDDDLVIVGSYTIDAISTPLIATATTDASGPWRAASPDLETYGSRITSGFGIQRILAKEDELWITVSSPFLQQLHRSSNDGQAWTSDEDLAGLVGNNLISNGLAIDQNGTLVIAGGDVAVLWDGSSFNRLEDAKAIPTQSGDLAVADIQIADGTWRIVGASIARTSSGFNYTSALWESASGLSWKQIDIDRPDKTIGVALHQNEMGDVTAILGGNVFYRDTVHLSSATSSGPWSTKTLDIPESVARLLPEDVATGPAGSLLISGSKLIELDEANSRSKPLFLIVEADGSSRESLLTSSPVATDLNGSVNCMSGVPGDYMAVLSWGTRQVEVASSVGGERWSSTNTNNDFDGLEVADCLVSDEERLVVGQDDTGSPFVATSLDGDSWSFTTLDGLGSVNGISKIQDELYLVGWSGSDLGADGAVWERRPDDSWRQLNNLGFESDEFSNNVVIEKLAEDGGIVVAIGFDQGRAGVWIASIDALQSP